MRPTHLDDMAKQEGYWSRGALYDRYLQLLQGTSLCQQCRWGSYWPKDGALAGLVQIPHPLACPLPVAFSSEARERDQSEL